MQDINMARRGLVLGAAAATMAAGTAAAEAQSRTDTARPGRIADLKGKVAS
jgi:hypothetical protein